MESSSNWQTKLSTIRERNEYVFNKSLFCDVEFSVIDSNGVKVTIPANKYILAVSSSVFEAMFYGQFEESRKSLIDLPDCTKEGLYELLRYVYSDKVNLTGSNVLEVLYIAEKYMLPFLVEKCKTYVQDEVGPDDVLIVLPQVHKIGDEKLQKHLWKIADLNIHRSVSSKSFLNASQDMICQILARDTLNINEVDLFRAVDRWADERIKEQGLESNGKVKRSILGEELIRLIRFPMMMEKEFAEVVLPCEILKKHEMIEIVQTFHNVSPVTNMFSQRKRLVGHLLSPNVRFADIQDADWDYDAFGDEEAIDFKVNKPVDLVGVCMFGKENATYDVALFIRKDTQAIYSSFVIRKSKKIDDLYYGFTIYLDKPVSLEPDDWYTVEAKTTGPPSQFGKHGKRVVAVGDITITYSTSPESSESDNGTTVDYGQFPTVILRNIDKWTPN